MIKKIKRITALFSFFFAVLLFFSCTFIHESKSAKVYFSAGKLFQNNSRAATSFNSNDYMEISLLGDYTETQTIHNINENTQIIFSEVPVEAQIYAEVYIYKFSALGRRINKYKGQSETIIVEEGDNLLTVKLKAITQEAPSAYKVIHLLQNIDDDEYSIDQTQDMEGKAGELTEAEAMDIPGFTVKAFEQSSIQSDDSTRIEIYYDRNLHTITYLGGADDVTKLSEKGTYRYGAKVTLPATLPERTGYAFAGWKDEAGKEYQAEDEITIEDADIILTAQWEVTTYNITYDLGSGSWAEGYIAPQTYTYGERQNLPDAEDVLLSGYGLTGWTTEDGTPITEISADMTGDIKLIAQWTAGASNYKVRHWQQNIDDDEYTEVEADKQTLAGISDENTNASANTYEGFTAKNFTQKTIQADGSTLVDIYYDRNTYEVSFNTRGGSTVAAQTIRYQAKASEPGEPVKNGNSFLGWYTSNDDGISLSDEAFDFETQITADITLYAKWSGAAVTVTVNSPDDESVEITCDSLTDPGAKELVFVIKNYVEGRSYKWYLDGIELTDSTPNFYIGGNTITMFNEDVAPGVYVITLSSGAYSSSIIVEISGN